MGKLNKLLQQNRNWAEKIKDSDPEFFSSLAEQQSPELLWIGCSDSRVPASQIIDAMPGQVFVHRNVANLVISGDINCLSVVQFAVEQLQVKHIVICGHYGCGGVKAALHNEGQGVIRNWLQHIRKVYDSHRVEIDQLSDEKQKINCLCELNVINQVINLCHDEIVEDAWTKGQDLSVHGWIYNIEDGLLKDLDITISGPDDIKNLKSD
ncbi:MAG: carbonate dehydratase [Gammaproteobacteria bacterium]|nr:carbonate dehydratase [Gammaproteobacteria bacterium]NIO62443.1 carbonate dehydratase [Gammaproteobacteria bacterium]